MAVVPVLPDCVWSFAILPAVEEQEAAEMVNVIHYFRSIKNELWHKKEDMKACILRKKLLLSCGCITKYTSSEW